MSNDSRDYQRAKVYRWENSQWWWDVHHWEAWKRQDVLSLDDMRSLAEQLTGQRIRVKDGRGRRKAGGCYNSRTIWMPRWSRTLPVLCHELAHTQAAPNDGGWHGPWFVAKYCLLLKRSGIVPSAQVVRASAIDDGIDVARLAWN